MNRQSRSVTRAPTMIADVGGRTTLARSAVLEVLLAAKQALNHQEIGRSLRKRGSPCDRVTLYRVLEWLVSHRLAHKIGGDDRVWRFNSVHNDLEVHPHFQCTHCRQVYCLEDLPPPSALTLPPGFRPEHTELMIQGTCPTCHS